MKKIIIEILKMSKLLSIKPYNNKTVNLLCLSRVNALKWILDQNNDNEDLEPISKLSSYIQ